MPKYSEMRFEDQRTNPAAPMGLRQQTGRYGDGTGLQPWQPTGPSEDTRSWWSGRNTEGVNNGWDTEFQEKLFTTFEDWNDKVRESMKDPDPRKRLSVFDMFDEKKNPGATGVATWDDPQGRFKRGDVYVDGKKQADMNVYEVYDEPTGNLMLARYMFGPSELKRYSRDSDPQGRIAREVRSRADEWSHTAKMEPGSRDYLGDVYEQQKQELAGSTDENLALASGASAALTAGVGVAVAGSWTGPGAILAGVLAAIPAGIAGWWGARENRDQLTEIVARTKVQAARAREGMQRQDGTERGDLGRGAELSKYLEGYSEVGMKVIAPFGNIVQGVYDKTPGDAVEDFYEVDPMTGQRKAPGIVQGLDLAATFADSVLQFSSFVGAGQYLATTGGVTAGKISGLAFTGGMPGGERAAGFNERTGMWDEYDGAREWMSAVGDIGIDALQMGVGAGLLRAGQGARRAFDPKAIGEGRAVENPTLFGMKYITRADGTLTRRPTLGLLVPSEQIGFVQASWRARDLARRRASTVTAEGKNATITARPRPPADAQGKWTPPWVRRESMKVYGTSAPGPDDYYRAAVEMQTNSTFRTALFNGFAEGWEEVVQGILEPTSFSEPINGTDLVRSFLYGVASGAGMGLGPASLKPNSARVTESRAKSLYMLRNNIKEISQEDWGKVWSQLDKEERRLMAIANPTEAKVLADIQDSYRKLMRMLNPTGSTIARIGAMLTGRSLFDRAQANRNANNNREHVLMSLTNGMLASDNTAYDANAMVMSQYQVMIDLGVTLEGFKEKLRAAKNESAKWTARADERKKVRDEVAVDTTLDPAEVKARLEVLDTEIARFEGTAKQHSDRMDAITKQLEVAKIVHAKFKELNGQYETAVKGSNTVDETARMNAIRGMNQYLKEAFQGRFINPADGTLLDPEAVRTSVEALLLRNPAIDGGSVGVYMPQVSVLLSRLNIHSTAFIHHANLKAPNADHDGDKGLLQNDVYIPPEVLQQMRRGVNMVEMASAPLGTITDRGAMQFIGLDGEVRTFAPESVDENGNPVLSTSRAKFISDVADGHVARVDYYTDAVRDGKNPARGRVVKRFLKDLRRTLEKRLVDDERIFDRAEFKEMFDAFEHGTMNGGWDAEETFIDALLTKNLQGMLMFADTYYIAAPVWVRAEIEKAYDRINITLEKQAATSPDNGPVSSGAPQILPEATAAQRDIAGFEASHIGMTLSILLRNMTDSLRQDSSLNYSPFWNAAVASTKRGENGRFLEPEFEIFIQRFIEQQSGRATAAVDVASEKDMIEKMVVDWLQDSVAAFRRDNPSAQAIPYKDLLLMVANIPVRDFDWNEEQGRYVGRDNETTLLQVLLRRAIGVAENIYGDLPEDEPISKKIKRLKRITHTQGSHSVTAKKTIMAIFGDVPLNWLIGDEAAAVFGGPVTLNQLKLVLEGKSSSERKKQVEKWRRVSDYQTGAKKDPPYGPEEIASGMYNGYTVLLEALIGDVNTSEEERAGKDVTASNQVQAIHTNLQSMLVAWRKANLQRLSDEKKARGEKGAVNSIDTLRDLVEKRHGVAEMIAKLVPDTAKPYVFPIKNGVLYMAPWVEEVMAEPDFKKFEKNLWLMSRFAAFNGAGGTLRLTNKKQRQEVAQQIKDATRAAKKAGQPAPTDLPEIPDPTFGANGIKYEDLKSRFNQLMWRLAVTDPTGHQLNHLIKMSYEAESLPALMDQINGNPSWYFGEAALLPYHDDVALYTHDPSDVWVADLPSQQYREDIEEISERLSQLGPAFVADLTTDSVETEFLTQLLAWKKAKDAGKPLPTNSQWDFQAYYDMLLSARQNAIEIGDTFGPAARMQLMQLVQSKLTQSQDKGKPMPELLPFGSPQVTMSDLGHYDSGLGQELSAQTSRDWDDIRANITGTVQGPVRIQQPDGSELEIDLSDPLHIIEHLLDPMTRTFTMSAIFQTSRDINKAGISQSYLRYQNADKQVGRPSIIQLLKESNFGHLGPRNDDGSLTYEQAEELVGIVDGILRQRGVAEGSTVETSLPVQNAINEILLAQGMHTDFKGKNKVSLARSTVALLGELLLVISQMPEDVRDELRLKVRSKMYKNFVDEGLALPENSHERAMMFADRSKAINAYFSALRADVLLRTQRRLSAIDETALTPAEYRAAQISILDDQSMQLGIIDDLLETQTQLLEDQEAGNVDINEVQAVIASWTAPQNDPNALAMYRANLITYLRAGHRIHRFVEKDYGRAMAIITRTLDEDPKALATDARIDPDMWDTLSWLAATVDIAERGSIAASDVGLPAMSDKNAHSRRYMDRSWVSLTDVLFDKKVLAAVTQIRDKANIGVQTAIDINQVADRITNNLLGPDKIGPWSSRYAVVAAKFRKLLLGSTALAAIQQHGLAPMKWKEAVAAGWLTTTLPDQVVRDEHHSTHTSGAVLLSSSVNVGNFIPPETLFKLERHFISSMQLTVTRTDGTVEVLNLKPAVSDEYQMSPDVVQAGYTVFKSEDLHRVLQEIANHPARQGASAVLSTEYVDVDKKPHTREYINSVLFDGVGREGVTSTTPGTAAELIFGSSAISKTGQQNPLNFMSKVGMAFRQILTTRLNKIKRIEDIRGDLATILRYKAIDMLSKQYETGPLLNGDSNSLYKLLKLRHVVRGLDAQGNWVYKWAEEVIAAETAGKPVFDRALPNGKPYQIIPISARTLQALYGRPFWVENGAGGMGEYIFNLQDIDTFPQLTQEHLASVGLTRLGEKVKANESLATSFNPLQVLRYKKAEEENRRTFRQQMHEAWQRKNDEKNNNRETATNKGLLNIPKENEDLYAELVRSMRTDNLMSILSAFGVPFVEAMSDGSERHGDRLVKQLMKVLNSKGVKNARLWHYAKNNPSNPATGRITRADVDNGFTNLKIDGLDVGPMNADFVIVDLEAQYKAFGGRQNEAFKDTIEAIRELSKTGIGVILSSSGSTDLRTKVSRWILEGGVDLVSVGGSNYMFIPVQLESGQSQTQRAEERTLIETRSFSPAEISYRFLNDVDALYWNENAVSRDELHPDYMVYPRPTSTILPGTLSAIAPNKHPELFNIVDVETPSWPGERDRLLDQLNDPEVRKHIERQNGDPDNVPIMEYDKDKDLYEYGIMSFDDAYDALIRQLSSNTPFLAEGSELKPGQFYLAKSGQNNVVMLRFGFKIPKYEDMEREFTRELKGRPGPLKLAVVKGEIDEMQTIPPPLIIRRVVPDERGYRLIGDYQLQRYGKSIADKLAFKAGFTTMPDGLASPNPAMNSTSDARVMTYGSWQAAFNKQATDGTVMNFRWLFALTGIDFRADLIKAFLGRDVQDEDELRTLWMTKMVPALKQWQQSTRGISASDARKLLNSGRASVLASFQHELNMYFQEAIPGWQYMDFLRNSPSDKSRLAPEYRIAGIILTALAVPGVEIEHVVGTQGLLTLDRNSTSRVTLLPSLVTEALADTEFPQVRKLMIDRANSNAAWAHEQPDEYQAPTTPGGQPTYVPKVDANGNPVMTPIYWFDDNLNFHIRMRDVRKGSPATARREFVGRLQILQEMLSEKNARSSEMGGVSEKGNVSAHTAAVLAETLQAWTARSTDPEKIEALDAYYGQNELMMFDDEVTFFDMLTRVRDATKGSNQHLLLWPFQIYYLNRAHEKYILLNKPLDHSGWSAKTEALVVEFLGKLNLGPTKANKAHVDVLLRQFQGAEGRSEDQEGDENVDLLGEEEVVQILHLMMKNVDNGMHPLHGGAIPLESETFWANVYHAQQALPPGKRWAPKNNTPVHTWDQWIDVLMGQVHHSREEFDPMYKVALDGFYHTYEGTTTTYSGLPISMDAAVNAGLRDPNTKAWLLSLDPSEQAFMKSPIVLEAMDGALTALIGLDDSPFRRAESKSVAASEAANRATRRARWRARRDMRKQSGLTVAKFMEEGATLRSSIQGTHNLFLYASLLQHIVRLSDPSLFFSAYFEVPFKNLQETATNLTGGMTLSHPGRFVQTVASIINKVPGVDWQPLITPEQRKRLRDIAKVMGADPGWLRELFGEMMYQDGPIYGPNTWLGRLLGKGANKVNMAFADPTKGMTQTTLAMRYIEATLEYLIQTDNVISIEQYIDALEKNPLWLKEQTDVPGMMNAHRAGVNRSARVRGARNSWVNKSALNWINRLEMKNGSAGAQWLGFLASSPFKYRRFSIGGFLAMTGLDGFDHMMAMLTDARPQKGMVGRLKAFSLDEDMDELPYTDHSDILEGVDLIRPFVRGGMTQTGWMLAGLLASGHGLTGEDEEARKRRKMMKYMNAPYYYDPRDLENQMEYADAIFFDSIPWLQNFFMDPATGRSAVVPHWIIRQFTSPMMGITRFFETGDLREIGWGFHDAWAAIPYSAINIIDQARTMNTLLEQQALQDLEQMEGQDASEQIETRDKINRALLSIVSGYERALFESNFFNNVRTAWDTLDRDPYSIPKMENGVIVRDADMNPVPSEGLESYREPGTEEQPGEVKQAYAKRDPRSATIHAYAENNLTFAVMASILSGQIFSDSNSFARKNMVPKQPSLQLPELTKAETEALVIAAYKAQGGFPKYTVLDLINMRKRAYEEAGLRWDQAQVEKEALSLYQSPINSMGGLTTLDADGAEVVTKDGARGIIKGLWNGSITYDDNIWDGVFITREMRDEIAAEWIPELVQEGIDNGLSQEGAQYYAKRIANGEQGDGGVPGLLDILYSKKIPTTGTVRYNQLNVTWIPGPDGMPVATPFRKQNMFQAFGIPLPAMTPIAGIGTEKDITGRIVDDVLGINTGMYAVERLPDEMEDLKPPEDLFDKAFAKTYTAGDTNKTRYPWAYYGRRGGGGGGGYSGGGGGYFQRMQPFPGGTGARVDGLPMINTSTPIIRRANVNRERVTSERGRLKQWQ